MQYTVIACVLNILSIINDCIDILKSGKFFASSNTVRSRKGARCFVGFTGLPEPQELQIQRHSSSLAQMSPFVRTPADAIESYAAAGYFSGNRILHTKRELRHFFPAAVLFYFLRPQHIPHIRPTEQFRRITQKKRQPLREGVPQIIRAGETTSSQALFRRP